jgi:alkanesulfonate monooxygenase SsuD/methylene tetrahydromethanopterin reductase-like flavin-dependent oxidoreductase (luciferase family)
VPEHHFGFFGCLPAPATLLAYVAAKTKRIQLAPATVLLPCDHPVRVAENFALLDLLSNGRAVFSAGRGYDKREYDAFEVDFAESRDRFSEGLDLLRIAWAKEEFTYNGRFYSIPEPITCLPRPVQKPHPPIYVACFSRPTVEMAAEQGFHTLFAPFAAAMMFGSVGAAVQTYKVLATSHGHTDARAKCSYFTNVVDNKADELRTKERLLHYLHSILPAFPEDRASAPPHIAYFADIVERLKSMKPENLGERSLVTGDPEACIGTLRKCEAAGIEEVILYFNFGNFGHRETLKSMERFARDVMPHF